MIGWGKFSNFSYIVYPSDRYLNIIYTSDQSSVRKLYNTVRSTLALKVLIGFILGILTGLFLGEMASVFRWGWYCLYSFVSNASDSLYFSFFNFRFR